MENEILSTLLIFFGFLAWVLILTFGVKYVLGFLINEELEDFSQRANDIFLHSSLERRPMVEEFDTLGQSLLFALREPGVIFFKKSKFSLEESKDKIFENVDFISGQRISLGATKIFLGDELQGGAYRIELRQHSFRRGVLLAQAYLRIVEVADGGSSIEVAVMSRGKRVFLFAASWVAAFGLYNKPSVEAFLFPILCYGAFHLVAWYQKLRILENLNMIFEAPSSNEALSRNEAPSNNEAPRNG